MLPEYDVVVIGYGNELRGDDGIGPRLAGEVAARNWPGVRVVAVAQLTPELAKVLADAQRAIFIDAGVPAEGEPVRVLHVEPRGPGPALTHFGDPHGLLALSRALYGKAPRAWLVRVAGHDFGLGEALSSEVQHRAQKALEHIESLVQQREL
jgi:hydrogenase maturation protease